MARSLPRPGFREAYRQYVDAGWGAVPFPPEFGGGGFPWLVTIVMQEMLASASLGFSTCPVLTQGAIDMLTQHGSPGQQATFLEKMVSGEWTGTMNLTEPQAGSDLGAVRTKAVPAGDGTWRITGQKIFITFGEHDLAGNIIHLVLARVPDAPPGTKGISCFIVPKYLVNEDGSLGSRNDLRCVSIEHKLGIRASPTCVMSFGDAGGATGYLIGEANQGMRYMFTMMNTARLSVGVQGLAIAERAYQDALRYAQERRQGRVVGARAGESSPIVEYTDVRRMLLTMKAYIEAMRALLYTHAASIDLAGHHHDQAEREARRELAELLTPISKAWCTDLGVELTSIGLQVHGGMGYVEETGVAQYLRDSRIAPIYEGTNGIQAIDLVTRKVPMRGGGVVTDLLAQMEVLGRELAATPRAGRGAVGAGQRGEHAAGSDRLDHVPPPGRAQRRAGRGDAVPTAVRPGHRRLAAGPVGACRVTAAARRGRLRGDFPPGKDRHRPFLRRATAPPERRPAPRGHRWRRTALPDRSQQGGPWVAAACAGLVPARPAFLPGISRADVLRGGAPRLPDQLRAWNGSMSCSPRSSRTSPAESSCSTGTGRPSRPVRPTASLREGNLARPARTSQIVSTTPRLTR